MDLVELLTVAERFRLQGRGIVVTPNFPAPAAGWKASTHTAVILTPTGQRHTTDVRVELWHFNVPDPALAAQGGGGLVLSFPAMTEDELPAGSRVLVPQALKDAIMRG